MAHVGYLALLFAFAALPPLAMVARLRRGLSMPHALEVLGRVLPGALVVGTGWDALAYRAGWWRFHPGLDVRAGGLPVEELAFMALCVGSVVVMTLALRSRPVP